MESLLVRRAREFHTFCHGGPMVARPLAVLPGPVVCRDGFCFADLRCRAAAILRRRTTMRRNACGRLRQAARAARGWLRARSAGWAGTLPPRPPTGQVK